MVLLGFNMGTSDNGEIGKSLDDIIANRRKEQSKALSGKKGTGARSTRASKDKKTAVADRSVATGRAKRAAAARARRGMGSGDKKPSAMEVEKEVYRQTRKTAAAKKASEKKATNGRVAPNSTLREKRQKKPTNADPPGKIVGRMPQAKQIKAAMQGMELAGCPVPKGYQLVMQFAPAATEKPKGKQTTKANTNNTKKNTNNTTNKNNNKNNNNNAGNRRKSGGRGKK